MTVEKPTITFVGCHPTNFEPGRGGIGLEAIVIHTTDGGADIGALDGWFGQDHLDAKKRGSSHYGIGPTGTIHQFVALTDTAYAQGILNGAAAALVTENAGINPNRWCVSIELVDAGIPGNHTPAQIEAAAKLAAWLFQDVLLKSTATGVAIDRRHILGHSEFDAVNRAYCPSWSSQRFADFVARVKLLSQPFAPPLPPVVDSRIQKAIDDLSAAAIGLDDLKTRASDLATRASLQAQSLRDAVARLATR